MNPASKLRRVKTALARLPVVGHLRDAYQERFGVGEYYCPALGLKLRLHRGTHGVYLRDPFTETHVIDFFRSFAAPDGVVIDVGALIGFYTVLLAKSVIRTGRVLAVEPLEVSRKLLEANVALHGLGPRVTVVPEAISDTTGQATFYIRRSRTGNIVPDARNSLEPPRSGSLEALSVNTITIDDLASRENLNRVDLIKIDVEGAELAAIRGATRTMAQFRPTMLVEVNDAPTQLAATELLSARGYRVRTLGVATHGTHLVAEPRTE